MTGESGEKVERIAKSIVADVIKFDASEDPTWRLPTANQNKYPKVEEMIQEIVEFQRVFRELKNKVSQNHLETVKHEFLTDFIFHLNREEDHGLGTKEETEEILFAESLNCRNGELSVEEQETLNIYYAHKKLTKIVEQEDESLYGFIEGSLVKELHKIILNDVTLPKGMTKPGECSNRDRFTTFQGQLHYYKKPDDMEEAMNTILDQFNSLLNWLKNEEIETEKVYKLFRASSWLLFEFLDLHPFSDGNDPFPRSRRRNMAEKKQRSDVAVVLDFNPTKNPWWRERESDGGTIKYPTVEEMIGDIVKCQREFRKERSLYDGDDLKRIQKDFLYKYIFQVNDEGGSGVGTLSDTKECLEKLETDEQSDATPARTIGEQETNNAYKAYLWLYKEIQEDISKANKEVDKGGESEENLGNKELYGLLEKNIVKELHKIILSQLPLEEGKTKPGECSNRPRQTTFEGETYEYQKPHDMDDALNTLIDRYNSLIDSIKAEEDDSIRMTNLFKISGWWLFEFLDLHPFSDGNGRLGRLLCNYALSVVTPFATPIYNIWSQSSKDDYMKALVKARKFESRHPESLTTMLIECNWLAWKEFNKQLQEQQQKKNKE